MAARKSFLRTAPEGEALETLLSEAARQGVTDAQLEEQRVSFAYGNAPVGSSSNKESVREDSKHNRLIHA